MGEQIITTRLPAGTTAHYEGGTLTFTKGNTSTLKILREPSVEVKVEGEAIILTPLNTKRKTLAILRTYESHIKNLIHGLQTPYVYTLAIVHSHFPMNVKVKERTLEIANYLGEKNPRFARIVGDNTKVDVKGKLITITGNNVEAVSQTAANIENACRNTKKDQRVFQDGIYITSKGTPA
ncbi:MAG: 50S ribosomal protein L6 [archaeon]|nr:50S ribosomal protein L6 [archaeon]